MKSAACFFIFAGVTLLAAVASFSQTPSPSPQTASAARANATVSVQELALSRKAVHAFEKGTALLLKGDAQASLAYFRTVLDEAPASFRGYHNLGLALYRLGQCDAAAQNFQKAIDLTNGAFAPSLFAFSMILYQQSEFSQAESLIRRGLLLEPYSAIGKYCLGLVQYSLGQIDEAQQSASESLNLDAHPSDAYILLARTHERQHNPAAVLSDVRNYLHQDPHGVLQPQALVLLQHAEQDLAPQSVTRN